MLTIRTVLIGLTALLSAAVVSDLLRVFAQLRDGGGKPVESVSYRLSGKIALRGVPVILPFDYRGEFVLRAAPSLPDLQ